MKCEVGWKNNKEGENHLEEEEDEDKDKEEEERKEEK